MNDTLHIHYLNRQEIDPAKWDACIEASPKGLIYARTFFLDDMTAGQWDGLVLNDYEAVMPLTWSKKFGFYYLHQPHFTPMLGVFHRNGASRLLNEFLDAVPEKFRYWDIDLNETNQPTRNPDGLPLQIADRCNYLLHLNKPYEEIRLQYKRLARRMQKRAAEEGLTIIRDLPAEAIIGHYQHHYKNEHRGVNESIYQRLASCTGKALADGKGTTYTAMSPDGEILAFYLVLSDRNFVYSLIGGSTDKGKEKGAFYLLTDRAINDHAESQRIFRFEGSDSAGIAFFDAQFGGEATVFPHLILNKLPFPVNLLQNIRRSRYQLSKR